MANPTPIPIVNGIYTDQDADFRTSYPVNLVPVPKKEGISEGYLRPADGLITHGTGPGVGRGGIRWNDICYRVMGSKLVKVFENGTNQVLGDVETDGKQVTLAYSFDRLGIASNKHLFYWKESDATLTKVTDPDLGDVLDLEFVDGYFVTTDGENLVQLDLNDPTQVDPFKYGSSEADPDPVKGIIRYRKQLTAVNRYTIESFDNVGGTGFVFSPIDGALISKGAIGTHSFCIFPIEPVDVLVFLGSGVEEEPAVYMGANGEAVKISTREIDQVLLEYDESVLANVVLETRSNKNHKHLWIRLPDKTLVYDHSGSQVVGVPVWFTLTTTLLDYEQYRAQNLVWCYNKWLCEDPKSNNYGYLVDNISSHYGQEVRWEFGTLIIYGEGNGAIIHELELVALTGRVALGKNPTIRTSWSNDGLKWSNERAINAGAIGNNAKRLMWMQMGGMNNWRIQRFRGDSQAFLSFARLNALFEPLAN